jgi:hypothetical protein
MHKTKDMMTLSVNYALIFSGSIGIAPNVSGLGEGGEYEAQNCRQALHLIRSTTVQLTTEPPLSLSPCSSDTSGEQKK